MKITLPCPNIKVKEPVNLSYISLTEGMKLLLIKYSEINAIPSMQ